MTFKTALRAKIKANATVTQEKARVDWNARPQATQYPAIVLETVSAQGSQHFLGTTGSNGDRIQATVLAKTQVQAETLRAAVTAALIADGIQDGVTFQRGFINLFRDGVDDTETGLVFYEIIDVTIWHN